MSFEIEKGIPLPTKKLVDYPFDKMQVGDSFLILGKRATNIGNLCKKAKDVTNFDFVCRTILEGENLKGARIWRIK